MCTAVIVPVVGAVKVPDLGSMASPEFTEQEGKVKCSKYSVLLSSYSCISFTMEIVQLV